MVAILYEEAAEEDLCALRVFEARRILDEVGAQLSRAPTRPTKRRKLLEGLVPPCEVIVRAVRRKGTKSTEEIL